MNRAKYWLVAGIVGALVVAGAACNSITGLDEYEKVECAGGSCIDAAPDVPTEAANDVVGDVVTDVAHDADGGPPDGDVEAGAPDADAAADAAIDAPDDVQFDAMEAGLLAHELRWARWKMPHEDMPATGDAAGPTPANLVDQTTFFKDHVTGLTWAVSSTAELTLEEAVGYCDALGVGPLEYRVPSRIELVTLLEPSLNPPHHSVMTDTKPASYWTASDVANDSNRQWAVNFSTGEVTKKPNTEKAYVRCVY